MNSMENCKSIYHAASILLKKEDDLSAEPYKSKYEAKKLLEELENILTEKLKDGATVDNELIEGQLAAVYSHLGTIGVETEELGTGQENFEKVVEISGVQPSHLLIYPSLLAHNSLAVLWALRGEQEKALSYLEEARNLYLKYKEKAIPPKTLDELFESQSEADFVGWNAMEKLHTSTLYYFAQVMWKNGRDEEAAEFCMATLQRQLSDDDYMPVSWASNAATLAQYFESRSKFSIARRLMAVSWAMLQTIKQEEVAGGTSSCDEYTEIVATISRRRGEYCIALLQKSCDDSDEPRTEAPSQESQANYLDQMNFSTLEYTQYELQIRSLMVTNVQEANDVFKYGLQNLTDSLKFFTLMEHAFTYTEITQQISTLYKLLAEFDHAPDRQSKMHRRRVVLLSDLVVELNPQYYLNECHQLNYEIGEAYSAMLDCKYVIVGDGQPTKEQTDKVNTLVRRGLQSFEKVLESFKSDENGVKILTEGYVRPALVAYFRMGRLWSKYIGGSKQEKANYLKKSVENYQKVIDYCQVHSDGAECVKEELKICQQMTELLPLKIERILAV